MNKARRRHKIKIKYQNEDVEIMKEKLVLLLKKFGFEGPCFMEFKMKKMNLLK